MHEPEHSEPDPRRSGLREPMVWLLIAIPLLTAIAAAATLGLVLHHPDEVLITHAAPAAEGPRR